MTGFLNRWAGALLFTATICGASAAPAAKTPTSAQATPRTDAVATAVLASRLAGYARVHASALAWLAAARLLSRSAPETKDAAGQSLLTRWLDESSRLAGSDTSLQGLISDARSSRPRGATEGPTQTTGSLGGRQGQTFTFTFEGNAEAAVAVMAPDGVAASALGGPDVDLYVSDERGTPVCTSEGPGMPEVCRWAPRRTGSFKVRVENRLPSTTDFSLIVR